MKSGRSSIPQSDVLRRRGHVTMSLSTIGALLPRDFLDRQPKRWQKSQRKRRVTGLLRKMQSKREKLEARAVTQRIKDDLGGLPQKPKRRDPDDEVPGAAPVATAFVTAVQSYSTPFGESARGLWAAHLAPNQVLKVKIPDGVQLCLLRASLLDGCERDERRSAVRCRTPARSASLERRTARPHCPPCPPCPPGPPGPPGPPCPRLATSLSRAHAHDASALRTLRHRLGATCACATGDLLAQDTTFDPVLPAAAACGVVLPRRVLQRSRWHVRDRCRGRPLCAPHRVLHAGGRQHARHRQADRQVRSRRIKPSRA